MKDFSFNNLSVMCNGSHDVLMMLFDTNDNTICHINGVDYHCIIGKTESIDLL